MGLICFDDPAFRKSRAESIETGVLYTWQVWQVFHDPSTSTSRLLFLMDVSI